MGGQATRCLPAVRGRACVDAWAGAASGDSFRAVAPVAVWDAAQLLRGGRVLYGKVPNNAYSQGRRKMETPRLTDAGAGRRLRWSLDIVERCIDQWAEAAMVGCKKSVLQS